MTHPEMIEKFGGRLRLLKEWKDREPEVYSIDGKPVKGYIERTMYWQDGKKVMNLPETSGGSNYRHSEVYVRFYDDGDNLLPLLHISGYGSNRCGTSCSGGPLLTVMDLSGQYPSGNMLCYDRHGNELAPRDGVADYRGLIGKDDVQPPVSISQALEDGWHREAVTFTPEARKFLENYHKSLNSRISPQNASSIEGSTQIEYKPEIKNEIKDETSKNKSHFNQMILKHLKQSKPELSPEAKEKLKDQIQRIKKQKKLGGMTSEDLKQSKKPIELAPETKNKIKNQVKSIKNKMKFGEINIDNLQQTKVGEVIPSFRLKLKK